MDQLEQLGVIVLLDAPAKVQLGVDNTSWIVGAKFKGVRMVPLGVHYVHYALADEKYQFKLGFFCVLTHQKRVVVRRWHTHYEDFLPVDEDTQRMYEHAVAVRDLDAYLGPYPVEKWSVWSLVSNYITQDVLDVLDPITPKQWTIEEEYKAENKQEEEVEPELEAEADGEVIDEEAPESQPPDRTEKTIKEEVNRSSQKEDFKVIAGTTYYTEIPQRLIKHGSSGQGLTSMNFDKSGILESLLAKEYKGNSMLLLGELQYSFVKFLLGEHYDSFEQWKRLFVLVTSCESYIERCPALYLEMVPLLYYQVQQLPKDFFVDPLSSNNFIKGCITNLIEVCSGQGLTGDRKRVALRAEKFRAMIQETFMWPTSIDDDEDAPQIVTDFEFVQI